MFVITGGGGGIGRALALALSERECTVLVIGRHQETLARVAEKSSLIHYHVADVSTSLGRASVVERLQDVSVLQGLVHNAGIIEPIESIQTIQEQDWHRTMATNVDAPLFLTQALFAKLQKARVLNIGSGAAHWPVPTWSAYCVSKAALWMLTRCWQAESSSMLVTSVMPGIVDTPMQTLIRQAPDMDARKQEFFVTLKKTHGLVSCDTVAQFLSWLLLDVDAVRYSAQEWDIYDVSHHPFWLKEPHVVPDLSTKEK